MAGSQYESVPAALMLDGLLCPGHAVHVRGHHPGHHHQPSRHPLAHDHRSLDRVPAGQGGGQQGGDRRRHPLQRHRQRAEDLQAAAAVRLQLERQRGGFGIGISLISVMLLVRSGRKRDAVQIFLCTVWLFPDPLCVLFSPINDL